MGSEWESEACGEGKGKKQRARHHFSELLELAIVTGDHEYIASRERPGNRSNGHGLVPALVDPDDMRGLNTRVDKEPWRQALHIAGDPMPVRAEQAGELDAARIFAQPVLDRGQLPVRRVGRDGKA